MTSKYNIIYIIKSRRGYCMNELEYGYSCLNHKINEEDIVNDIVDTLYKLRVETYDKYVCRYTNVGYRVERLRSDINKYLDSEEELTDAQKERLKRKETELESELNRFNKIFSSLSGRIKKLIINDKELENIRINLYGEYHYNETDINILIFESKTLKMTNLGHFIGDIEHEIQKRKEQNKNITTKKNHGYYSRYINHSYTFRCDPVPNRGGYHRGASASKRGTGLHTKVLADSIPEYKEYHNRHKYKFIDWDYPYREVDESWKGSKVKKQYMKHDHNKKRSTRIYKEKYRSLKDYFTDERTLDEITEELKIS